MRRRVFGFRVGSGAARPSAEFERLCSAADEAGVRWQDLVQDGYRVRGDLYAGGVLIRYDWPWRIAELRRRLDEAGESSLPGR